MTDKASAYLVVYRVKKSGKYRTRVYYSDGDLNSLSNTTQVTIISVKVVNPAEPGEGFSWITAVKNFFSFQQRLNNAGKVVRS